MKLLVIGQSVVDYVKTADKIIVQPGGIFYTVTGLLSCADKIDAIFLCTSIEKANYNLFSDVFEKVNTTFFQKAGSIPKVLLNLESGMLNPPTTGRRFEIRTCIGCYPGL